LSARAKKVRCPCEGHVAGRCKGAAIHVRDGNASGLHISV